jgi:ADP-ribose pyrophosphatase YjhB (NUDIX family)
MRKVRAARGERALRLDDALELMRVDGHRLMLMHSNKAPNGMSYYLVPGGFVEDVDAQKIIRRDDVRPLDEGLFPGCTQSWKMGE